MDQLINWMNWNIQDLYIYQGSQTAVANYQDIVEGEEEETPRSQGRGKRKLPPGLHTATPSKSRRLEFESEKSNSDHSELEGSEEEEE